MAINENLKLLRIERGYTQEELAAFVNVNHSAIAHYEKGIRTPKFTTVMKLAEILGVTCEELVYGKQEEKQNEET